jgi:hypothetical protein
MTTITPTAIGVRLRPLLRITVRSRLASLIAAGAIAVGMTILTAPAANAIPESTIKGECAAANGTYSTTVSESGTRYSKCCYKDYQGNKYCDFYMDGTYVNQNPNLPTSPTPTQGFQPAPVGPLPVEQQPPPVNPTTPVSPDNFG